MKKGLLNLCKDCTSSIRADNTLVTHDCRKQDRGERCHGESGCEPHQSKQLNFDFLAKEVPYLCASKKYFISKTDNSEIR